MTARILSPDTSADQEIYRILTAPSPPSFSVVAGAGSGKTTSLVKALSRVASVKGVDLAARSQQIACITYTEVAAEEIFLEVGTNPLVHVSTIHSFLWRIIAPFQADIGSWVRKYLESKIVALTAAPTSKRARSAKSERDEEKRTRQLAGATRVDRWTYGLGNDYPRGVVGHSDILLMVPELLIAKPLLARIVAAKFPFIFVDESQDTDSKFLDALLHLQRTHQDRVCLGLFGDPMQRIHFSGVSSLPTVPGWQVVKKPENFRSSRAVLDVVNHIRAGADGLHQISGLPPEKIVDGEAFFFVLPADSDRAVTLAKVRAWLDSNSESGSWTSDTPDGAKILLIMHKIAARRLGFENLYAAFHQRGSGPISDAFDEGTAWPMNPLINSILPLCASNSRELPAAALRASGAVLSDERLHGVPVLEALATASQAVEALRQIAKDGGPGSIGKAFRSAYEAGLVPLDPRLAAFLDESDVAEVVLPESTRSVLEAFMACDLNEVNGYLSYVNRSSPYSTQHGTKGAEFPRVIVVLDDNEESWSTYSYEKLLGLRKMSAKDEENRSEGRETVLDRTRRLLYVCASRARESLAIVLYTPQVDEATRLLMDAGYPGANAIHTLDDIGS